MNDFFNNAFAAERVMVILRGQAPETAVALAEQAWDAGLTAVEVPIHVPEALPTLQAVVRAGAARGFQVGAGTVISAEQVEASAQAGAAYTVAPGFDARVVHASLDAGLAHMPGVATASEIQQVLGLGLTWVKAFPASILGPSWVSAIHGPFPSLNIVATGGISLKNGDEYLRAGARVVGVGSGLNDVASLSALR